MSKAKKKEALPKIERNGLGLIIYCDGSIFGSPPGATPIGSGLHAVLFDSEPYDGKVTDKELVFTTHGYLYKKENASLKKFPEEEITTEDFIRIASFKIPSFAKPIWIRDCAYGWEEKGTNQIAEIMGMVKALEMVLDVRADVATVFTDSEYVLNGASKWMPNWIKNNWVKNNGAPVPNQEHWKKLNDVLNRLKEEKLTFRLAKIKGHKNAKGDKNSEVAMSNEFADINAKIGSSLGNSLQAKQWKLNGNASEVIIEQTLEESIAERKPQKIHPFLMNKRYYCSWGERIDKKRHYVGNPGQGQEDIYIGKQIPDASLGIIYLEEENETINMIEEIQNFWLRQHYGHDNYITTFMLDNISNTKDYLQLDKWKQYWLARRPGVPSLMAVNGKEMTYVNDPVLLSLKNIEYLKDMETALSLWGTDKLKVTDITDTLYETIEKPTSDSLKEQTGQTSLKVGKGLLKSIGATLKSIDSIVKFGEGEKEETRTITLTAGIDIPRRNQLKAVDDEYPVVKVLSWHISGSLYGYGFLIQIHKEEDGKLVNTGFGFWRGTFSSQIFIK